MATKADEESTLDVPSDNQSEIWYTQNANKKKKAKSIRRKLCIGAFVVVVVLAIIAAIFVGMTHKILSKSDDSGKNEDIVISIGFVNLETNVTSRRRLEAAFGVETDKINVTYMGYALERITLCRKMKQEQYEHQGINYLFSKKHINTQFTIIKKK